MIYYGAVNAVYLFASFVKLSTCLTTELSELAEGGSWVGTLNLFSVFVAEKDVRRRSSLYL